MAERVMLPVLPMRDTVVFPGVALPISAGRPGTIEAIAQIFNPETGDFMTEPADLVELAASG